MYEGWAYMITIAYSATDVAIYQQDVVIHRSKGTSYEETAGGLRVWHVYVGNRCKSDYGDVRFTDASGNALPYYLWPDYDSSSARFCVRLEGADQSGALTVYYGNPTATTTSDGNTTYLLYDHFDGSTIDTEKWTILSGPITVSGSKAVCPIGSEGLILSTATFGDALIESRWHRYGGTSSTEVDIVVRAMDSTHFYQAYTSLLRRIMRVYKRVEETYSVISTDASVAVSPDGWYTQRVKCSGSTIQSTIGDAVTTAIDVAYPSGSVGLKSNWGYEFDYIIVRAYSATPPAAITFGPGTPRYLGLGITLGTPYII